MITEWIDTFRSAWLGKDIDAVMALFSDDVEYWETPFQKIASKDLPNAWNAIQTQENIQLAIEPLVSNDGQHVLRWKLAYDRGKDVSIWAGLYVLKLNDDGKCEYFYQVGEKV